MKTKKKRGIISEWVAIVTLGLVLASYIWTVSFKFARFEEKLDNVSRDVQSMKVNTDKIPLIEFRLDKVENRLDKLETRVEAVETRLVGVEARLVGVEKKMKP